jgi:excisionase family DNA binding protein
MKYKTIQEVADLLPIKKTTIYSYIQKGYVEAIKPGRDWLIDQKEVDRLVKKYKNKKNKKKI